MKRKHSRKTDQALRGKPTKILTILILVMLFISLAVIYSRSPAQGSILPIPNSEAGSISQNTELHYVHFNDGILSFDYPSAYTESHDKISHGRIVEQLSLKAYFGVTDSRQVGVTVIQYDSSSTMQEDSAYIFRSRDNANYTTEKLNISNHVIEKMSKRDGGEVAYFIPGNIYYAVVVGTSTRPNGDYLKDVLGVVTSFVWP